MPTVLSGLGVATALSGLSILTVLALRQVLRRWFDARMAYAAWSLVPLSLLAACIPAPASISVRTIPSTLPEILMPGAIAPVTQVSSLPANLMWIWCAGALIALALLAQRQIGFVSRLGKLVPSNVDGVVCADTPGPLLLGMFKPRVVLPHTAKEMYSERELDLIIAHERVHARRGDLWANALCAGFQIAFWFNPLVHLAAHCFRYDQELACDEAVLNQFPEARKTYATAILKTQLASQGAPLVASWRAAHPMKGRIMNINAEKPGALRRALGQAALAAVVAGACAGVWAHGEAPAGDSVLVDMTASIKQGGKQGSINENRITLKLITMLGKAVKIDNDTPCRYELSLAPNGSNGVMIDMPIHCDGKLIGRPKLSTEFGVPARIVIDDGEGLRLEINATVTKSAEKQNHGTSTPKA